MANKEVHKAESRSEHRKQKQFSEMIGKRYVTLIISIAGGLILGATAIFYVYPKIMNEGKIPPNVTTKTVAVKEVKKDSKEEKSVETKTEKPAEEPTKNETKATEKEKQSNEFLLPVSNQRKLTDADIKGLSPSDLRLARNEIYARHGFVFKSSDLTIYFTAKSWYHPNPAYNGALNDVEKYNLNFIKARE
ncbi:YARHG domain-containing protein [Gottfriedia luciferensis]|uniref:YARHG domain-containing protein n=1 Tax=Gottfriedia luciferensis TaxID=178774 RepID=UPI000B44F356|nr:YARHG domain-containing protein [Gottfriedia luciferensis]